MIYLYLPLSSKGTPAKADALQANAPAAPAAPGAPPPPPGAGPPPPPPPSVAPAAPANAGGDDRSALFEQLNKGANVTKGMSLFLREDFNF